MPLPIATDRLTLRRFEEGDVAAILRLSADPSVHEEADELGSNEDEALTYIRAQLALTPFQQDALFDLAIVPHEVGELVGMATVVRGATTAEVGFALHSDYRGRGYATETASALVDTAFRELAVDEVQAQVAPDNAASRAVLARIGLREVGDRFEVREAGDLAYAITRPEWAGRSS
ncbi:MAG: GNAT family N-acetyltransferase [Chloroflexi bacterium]|nr:GNAT family N-acetyltransferase [Chloroflexota bacterium]MDA1147419.1 GNAT family N-acetyltransferase [Chloroflexota bacterium]